MTITAEIEAKVRKRMKGNRNFKKRVKWYMLGQCRCHCCGVQMTWDSDNTPRSATVEHLVPASAGGTFHMINTLVTCRACNQSRGTQNWIDFVSTNSFPKAEWLIDRYIKAVLFYSKENNIVDFTTQKIVQQYLKKAA